MYEDIVYFLRSCDLNYRSCLQTTTGIDSRIQITEKFLSDCDKLLEIILSIHPEIKFDCMYGCNSCCTFRVDVLPVEAFLIAKHLEHDNYFKNEIIEGIQIAASYANGRKPEAFNIICPFNNESKGCSIYHIRPYKCRVYYSGSKSYCMENETASQNAMVMECENELSRIFIDNMKKKRYIMNPYELNQAVLLAVNDRSIMDKWISKENVYPLLPEGIVL